MQSSAHVQIVQEVGVIGDSQRSIDHFGTHEPGIGLLVLFRYVVVDLHNVHLVVLVVVQVVQLEGIWKDEQTSILNTNNNRVH